MNTRLIGLLAALVLAATACGEASASSEPDSLAASGEVASLGDQDIAETEAETTDAVDTESQLLEFAECLRDQGFDIDDPTVDSDGNVLLPRPTNTSGEPGPPSGFLDARDACAEHLEGVTLGFGGGGGGDQTELQDQLLAFSACMRENGFDLPDPNFSEAGGRGLLREIDQNDPTYQAAFANCDDILGGFGAAGARGGN